MKGMKQPTEKQRQSEVRKINASERVESKFEVEERNLAICASRCAGRL